MYLEWRKSAGLRERARAGGAAAGLKGFQASVKQARKGLAHQSGAAVRPRQRAIWGEVVRAKGLEPPRLAPPEPKSGVSTNSTTPAPRDGYSIACTAKPDALDRATARARPDKGR